MKESVKSKATAENEQYRECLSVMLQMHTHVRGDSSG